MTRHEKNIRVQGRKDCKEHANEEWKQMKSCPIVGIGASAGGLEAFARLLENLPVDSGMAFVFIQHMEPKHESGLPAILSKKSKIPVSEVKDQTIVQPDHVYIIPPNTVMSVLHGVLNLSLREDFIGVPMSIDYFLESLAKDQGSTAVGVVLSGTATDGSRGLKEIKAVGGITFAQSPQSSKFDGMPISAIATGAVDFVLPPEEIGSELVRIACSRLFKTEVEETSEEPFINDSHLKQIYILLRKASGIDFTNYKKLTVKRRILRQMVLHRIEKLKDYINYLTNNHSEVVALYQDILINVTDFFRDSLVFENLKSLVFPQILKERKPDEVIRVWIPGCSTGEEAYSIAISLLEFLGSNAANTQIQIFATDINEIVIDKARTGIYPTSIKANVSPERLSRFFVQVNKGYQIHKTIREMCIFAKQDITKDPPFSRLDLISCRNLIIYFEPTQQKKLFPMFHYALKQTGFLLLGTSESVGTFADLFNLEDKKCRIYSKKAVPKTLLLNFVAGEQAAAQIDIRPNYLETGLMFDIQKAADQIVQRQYAPAGVIINSELEIIQFRGHTGAYLEPASGTPSLDLLKMTRDGLLVGMRTAINRAKKENVPVRVEGLQTVINGQPKHVNVNVLPIGSSLYKGRYFLVLFEDVVPQTLPEGKKAGSNVEECEQAEQQDKKHEQMKMEQELKATKEYLQSIVEQYETVHEELRSANEEIQSSNEELQSMNEELETAKEELQSTNEELMTLNEESQNRNQDLINANSDLQNLFRCIKIPVVMIDNDLCIRSFNFVAEKILNLVASDIGRPISNINPNINIPDLERMMLEVLDTLVSKEQEVQGRWGQWYSMQIHPYKTIENKINGVVITFTDINTIKKSYELSQEALNYAEAIVDTVREPLLVLDANMRLQRANKAFYQIFKVTQEETINQSIFELGNGQWNINGLRILLEEILGDYTSFENYEVTHEFPHIGYKKMLVNARPIINSQDQVKTILMAIEDVTSVEKR